MTRFNIEQVTDWPDRIYVEVDHRFNVALVRTGVGLELRVYPRSDGELWDAPFTTFVVDEGEIIALEIADGLTPCGNKERDR
jgi:hypothetical protein